MYKTILVPIDLAEIELTQKVVPHINSLSKMDDPHIHFLAVLYPMLAYYEFGLSQPDRLLPSDDERVQIALAELKKVTKLFDIPEDRIHCSVEIGAPRDRILNLAEEISADLLVVGSRRPNITTYLLGTTASSVVRYARTSVLVVR
ncbi:universal stress protein [Serratia sp. L9]|uniref:universal stress protein n=1 Tax=Serratia sp. L9 TaxID=3423946 RepID=UPI003D67EFA5